MKLLGLIIRREFITKVKNKTFLVMTFVTPIIGITMIALIFYLMSLNTQENKKILVLDDSELFQNTLKNTDLVKYELVKNINLEDAKKKTQKENKYGLVYIPNIKQISNISNSGIIFYSEASPSMDLINDIENLIEKKAKSIKIKELGINLKTIEKINIPVSTTIETFEGKKTSKMGGYLKSIFGGALGYLLFMFIIVYGNMIMRSIIEEKTSRIIEIIISSVKPTKLLLGKILGTSMAGVLQFLIWIFLGGFLMFIASLIFGIDSNTQNIYSEAAINSEEIEIMITSSIKEILNLPLANLMIMFILYFIGGYLLYSSLFAAVGAAVDSETDTQQFMLPIMSPLMLAIYIGFTVIENPHGVISQVFSFIPFTSPIVMLMRIPFDVPIWQQIISLIILFLGFYFIVKISAKIYRIGILTYGKKPSYKEIIKWLKY